MSIAEIGLIVNKKRLTSEQMCAKILSERLFGGVHTERVILHVDCNKFYASVECLHRPEIREKPVAVGGSVEKRHGIILTRNEIAASYGVKTAETIFQAKRKCPDLVIVPPNFPLYMRFSNLVRSICMDYTDLVEPFGLDESWLDVTGSRIFGSGEEIAEKIRKRVKEEIGITVSIGVSFNKVFAKLGSDYKKPDAITVFTKENFREKIWPLPASDLLYVGKSCEKKLRNIGITTIGDIALCDPEILSSHLGKQGYVIHSFANGLDSSPVISEENTSTVKSISNGTTLPRNLTDTKEVSLIIRILSESVARRMRDHGFRCTGVGISVRDSFLFSVTRQKTVSPTDITEEICSHMMSLFEENYEWKNPVRALSVCVSGFEAADSCFQPDLFHDEEHRTKLSRLDGTLDKLKKRYGSTCVRPASLLQSSDITALNPYDDHLIHPVGFF